MGVTIHYEGKARNRASASAALSSLQAIAKSKRWKFQRADADALAARVFVHAKCDPVHLEFDSKLRFADFVKTQFAPIAVHIAIVRLLDSLREHFSKLDVFDESGYWESRDTEDLKRTRADVTQGLKKLRRDHPEAHGPVQLPDGRWIDLVS